MGLILQGDNDLPPDPLRSQMICKGDKLFLIDVCCGLRNYQSPEQLDGLHPSEWTHENEEPNDRAVIRSVVVSVSQ
jgi:hypothetical protein